jgi:hypothetical protein
MGSFEIIDRLCAVTSVLSDIVRKQAEIVEQADVSEKVKQELRGMRKRADDELDLIEYRQRRI